MAIIMDRPSGSSCSAWVMAVSMKPGPIALTRMLCGMSSMASVDDGAWTSPGDHVARPGHGERPDPQ
jgi:hypothetical protein